MAPRFRFRPRVIPLTTPVFREALDGRDPVDASLAALADRPGLVALDSAGGRPCAVSVVGFDPLREIGPEAPVDDLTGLRSFAADLAVPGEEALALEQVPGPFRGGFLGALAYELGIAGEDLELPAHPWDTPRAVGGLYCDYLVIDHRSGVRSLVLGEDPGDGRRPWSERRDEVLARLAGDAGPDSGPGSGPGPIAACAPVGPMVRHVAPADHGARIEDLRQRIGQGDLYQANLAHSFSVPVEGDPLDLYRRLRRVNPSPYAGFLRWRHGPKVGAILSASPELLVELDGESARTRPIKGTIARGVDAVQDAARRAELLASEKDLAELAMIVDLERNDLGRVAQPGSVRVDGFPSLETYASVHHLVADVVATPRSDADAFDVVGALFPGGSITGAPKIASMLAIRELEQTGRGFFTGSLGFVDTRGHARFNILIRTLVWRPRPGPQHGGGEVSFHVGGGITWSSDAGSEERETLDKGSALAAALFPGGEVPAGYGALAPLWPVGARLQADEAEEPDEADLRAHTSNA